jgi:hypothetical protein
MAGIFAPGYRKDSLQVQVGEEQYRLLKSFLGTSDAEAMARARQWQVWAQVPTPAPPMGFLYPPPAGLLRKTIDLYERLSDRQQKLDKDRVGTQKYRQELCEYALKILDALRRDSF